MYRQSEDFFLLHNYCKFEDLQQPFCMLSSKNHFKCHWTAFLHATDEKEQKDLTMHVWVGLPSWNKLPAVLQP